MQMKSNKFALATLTALFFVMGFITVLNDILIPHLKAIFELNYFESALVQFCFFGAYFITGGFFGKLLEKVGYPIGVVLGFVLTAIGCILFYPAASTASYPIFFGAFFVLAVASFPGASKVTKGFPAVCKRTIPLAKTKKAPKNIGTTLGPIFGATFILSATAEYVSKTQEAQSVQIPYLMIAN